MPATDGRRVLCHAHLRREVGYAEVEELQANYTKLRLNASRAAKVAGREQTAADYHAAADALVPELNLKIEGLAAARKARLDRASASTEACLDTIEEASF